MGICSGFGWRATRPMTHPMSHRSAATVATTTPLQVNIQPNQLFSTYQIKKENFFASHPGWNNGVIVMALGRGGMDGSYSTIVLWWGDLLYGLGAVYTDAARVTRSCTLPGKLGTSQGNRKNGISIAMSYELQ